ncbi:hypothetical protein WDU94_012728 [Cyamophila willieti]
MFFTRFTNLIYSGSELASYSITLLHIYIVWREYTFIGAVERRMPETIPYMSEEIFEKLKKISRKILLVQLISDSWKAAIQIIFSDELAHISLWTISLRITNNTSSEMYTTCVFIFFTTCKDFFLQLPLNVYYLLDEQFSALQILAIISVEFFLEQIVQQILLTSLVLMGSAFLDVSSGSLMITSSVLICSLLFAREMLIDIVLEDYIKPFQNKKVLRELRPYLKTMDFPEENIYVLKTNHVKDVPNAFTMGHRFLKNQKVVISDNIIGKNPFLNDCCSYNEVVAILMHELGHVYYYHVTKTAIMEIFIALSTSIMFLALYRDIVFESFGFNNTRPIIVGMFIRMDLLLTYNMVCGLVYMIYCRKNEHEADFFSYTFTKNHLCKALIKLHAIHPSDILEHDLWYSTWNHDHPSLGERLQFLRGK